tara:strand:- start:30630 stop:30935 length:306 start_codon:yes stop_codon:yes gene_type:complete
MEGFRSAKELYARKKVKLIKEFYWFVGMVCLITLGSLGVVYFLSSKNASSTVIWIFAVVPVATWIIVFVEYLRIFGAGLDFVKRWEGKQIKKIMQKTGRET